MDESLNYTMNDKSAYFLDRIFWIIPSTFQTKSLTFIDIHYSFDSMTIYPGLLGKYKAHCMVNEITALEIL